MSLITTCTSCGSKRFASSETHSIPIKICETCGLIHQDVNMTPVELSAFYGTEYKYGHTYEQDRTAALARLKAYRFSSNTKLLDVGCGNAAFLDACLDKGLDAVGCELSEDLDKHKHVYLQDLCDINFPTDGFDVVTSHDLLEHVMDPKATLAEMFRVLKQKGCLRLEIPDFNSKRHWKITEHLWMFNEGVIKNMLTDVGFTDVGFSHPIEGKLLFKATKPKQERVKILVPPGIGDIYWSMTKIQSFCEVNKLGMPDVFIMSPTSLGGSKDRSIDYVRRIPFVNAAGYRTWSSKGPVWKEAYAQCGRTIFKDVVKCDYFISYNGVMRFGHSIDQHDLEYTTDWFPPMHQDLEERRYGKLLRDEIGPYYVSYFIPHGMYLKWLNEFSISQVSETNRLLYQRTKQKSILIGAKWDANTGMHKQLIKDDEGSEIYHDLTGKTSLSQCFSLLRNAQATIGFPSGITIMSAAFRKPTVMLWNDFFPEQFHWRSCPPQSRDVWYDIANTKDATPSDLVSKVAGVTGLTKIGEKRRVERVKRKTITPRHQVKETATTPAKKGIPTVVCVYKTGGDFTEDYVINLRNAVGRHLKGGHRFICLSDEKRVGNVETQPLTEGWPGWWSKLELFKDQFEEGPIIYLDLDTLVTGDFSALAQLESTFTMIKGFRQTDRRGSGIMAWHSDMSFLFEEFKAQATRLLGTVKDPKALWDQIFILRELRKRDIEPDVVQKHVKVASYKNHCKGGLPEGTQLVCFHGKPRPSDVQDDWVVKEWK